MSHYDWFTTCLLNSKKTMQGSSASREDILAKAKQADALDSHCLDLKATFLLPFVPKGLP